MMEGLMKFDPLTLANVHGGEFLQQAETALQKLQADLLEFMARYGDEADGAKGKLTMELSLAIDEAASCTMSVKAAVKVSSPQSPSMTMLALPYSRADGTLAVHVKRPKPRRSDEAKLFPTERPPAAETVDEHTGEVIRE